MENFTQIDDRTFRYKVTIFNGNGTSIQLLNSGIEYLEIEDTIFSGFSSGHLIANSSQEGIEGLNKSLNFYTFRGDHDYINIEIEPEYDKSIVFSKKAQKSLRLSITGVISDIKDISNEFVSKGKAIFFRDISAHFLHERVANINSSDFIDDKGDILKLSNSGRSINTGILIKELLKQVLEIDDSYFGNFDVGANKMFFQSTNNRAIDDLNYLRKYHISELNGMDVCLLRKERNDIFTFMPISKYFELQQTNPSQYVLESLVIGGSKQSIQSSRYPVGPYLPDYSNIYKYKIANISGENMMNDIRSSMIISKNNSNNVFKFGKQQGFIEQCAQDFYDLYVKPFKHIFGNTIYSNVPLNKTMRDNQSFNISRTVTPHNYESAVGRNKVLMSMLFKGDVFQTTLRGYTHRQSGRFVDIHRSDDKIDVSTDKKVIGRWFVTSVRHIITRNTYENKIECIKPYYIDLINKDDVV